MKQRRPGSSRARVAAGALAATFLAALFAVPSQLTPAAGAATADPAAYTESSLVAADWFDRTVTRGLGKAPLGGEYSVNPTSARVSVSSSHAHVKLAPGQAVNAVLPKVSATDVEVRHALRFPTVSASHRLWYSALLRQQSGGATYRAKVHVADGGKVSVIVTRARSDGSEVTLGTAATGITLRSGDKVRFEARVVGSTPVRLSIRAWLDGEAAPGWQLKVDDSSSQRLYKGALGLRAYESSRGGTMSFSQSSWTATKLVAPVATTTTIRPATTVSTLAAGGSGSFTHPGIVNSREQIAFVKGKIAAKQEPWISAFNELKASRYASLNWQPKPRAVVSCGSGNNPDYGCSNEIDDAQAAYTHALIWAYTGDRAHAKKAIAILDAWSAVLKTHSFDTKLYVNGKLVAAWTAETFTKAAEIMRHTGAGWANAERFESMLIRAHLPLVKDGWKGGAANWLMSMAEATMNIGVFADDRAIFDEGLKDWRNGVRSTIYLASDGADPISPPGTSFSGSQLDQYWKYPKRYVDGLQAETCRDAGHMTMGLAATAYGAETARIQGIDLYGQERRRIVAAMEYNARFMNNRSASGWVCPKPLAQGGTAWALSWEVAYNHYAHRAGVDLPETKRWIAKNRPTDTGLHMNWESLTHAGGRL